MTARTIEWGRMSPTQIMGHIQDRQEEIREALIAMGDIARDLERQQANLKKEAEINERDSLRAEISTIHQRLCHLPEGSVIDRLWLEGRLKAVQDKMKKFDYDLEGFCTEIMGVNSSEEYPPLPEEYTQVKGRPAAGPWEPYSDDLYNQIKDPGGRVWAKYGRDWCCIRPDGDCWRVDGTDTLRGKNPDRIARIIPGAHWPGAERGRF